ncbi:hypothetical protein JCM6292_244 [Bacteroides pyogenes JCM 6292]|uniref:Uncharacterized protein n=1 Tax=Bacteroides pyogenes JCM 6292 TaxID=1235809 RepID=W4P3D4_9BACE|nr:hypothetical protein JCM6292_244 [Bacteroides pyogenes JCM 6292]
MSFRDVGEKPAKHRLRKRDSDSISPLRSPIFITPIHRASTPVSPSEISNAVFDESNVEFMMAVNISVSPMNTTRQQAMMKAMTKKPIQM